MPSKVQFKVIHVSSQDEHFKGSELNVHGPTTKGWQSARYESKLKLKLSVLKTNTILTFRYHNTLLIFILYFICVVALQCDVTQQYLLYGFAYRYCTYPQDIIIQLDKRTRVKKIQVLSHQYLIRE